MEKLKVDILIHENLRCKGLEIYMFNTKNK